MNAVSTALQAQLTAVDATRAQWQALESDVGKSAAHRELLRAAWTHHSNALEGNTLTLGDTIFFLREGLTTQGKPLKDFLETRNHAEAIDVLYDVVTHQRALSEGLLKELNALMLRGIPDMLALGAHGQLVQKSVAPGVYKRQPNSVLTVSGAIHEYVAPEHVATEMAQLVQDANARIAQEHPILIAADLHYGIVRIHPFDDCNGRVARLAMNLILLRASYPPAVIDVAKRREYLTALESADAGNREPFYQCIAEGVMTTLRVLTAA